MFNIPRDYLTYFTTTLISFYSGLGHYNYSHATYQEFATAVLECAEEIISSARFLELSQKTGLDELFQWIYSYTDKHLPDKLPGGQRDDVVVALTSNEQLPENCVACKFVDCNLAVLASDPGKFKKSCLKKRHKDCPLRLVPAVSVNQSR